VRTGARGEEREPRTDAPVADVPAAGLDDIERGKGLARHAQRPQSMLATRVDHGACHRRMNMKMMMRIHMVELEAGRCESIELRGDLGGELFAHFGTQEDLRAERRHVPAQPSLVVDEIRDGSAGKCRPSIDEREVQPDTQRRKAAGALDRIGDGGPAHHQTGGAQDAAGVRYFDGAIDFGRQAEVVGGDDQRLQCALCRRSRRNWKNSTPSRSRRFIISGLLAISPTIDAIFERRK